MRGGEGRAIFLGGGLTGGGLRGLGLRGLGPRGSVNNKKGGGCFPSPLFMARGKAARAGPLATLAPSRPPPRPLLANNRKNKDSLHGSMDFLYNCMAGLPPKHHALHN